MEVDSEWCKYCECADLLWKFMDKTLPALWSKKTVELNLIKSWFVNLDKVPRFDNFCAWESCMNDDYPETMQELYDTLKFDRGKENRVQSPRGTDWTVLVFVIRYEYLKHQLEAGTRQAIRDHVLSMQLLDKIEQDLRTWTIDKRTSSPNAAPRRDTPEPKRLKIDSMLARLRDFTE